MKSHTIGQRHRRPRVSINDDDRELYCLNNEGWYRLYNQAKNKREFIRWNRSIIDNGIRQQNGWKL